MARPVEHFFGMDRKRAGKHSGWKRGAFWRQSDSSIRSQANRKRNLPLLEPTKPLGRDKLSIPEHDLDIFWIDTLEKSLERPAVVLSRGASPIGQNPPADGEGNPFVRDTHHQNVHRSRSKVPLRAIENNLVRRPLRQESRQKPAKRRKLDLVVGKKIS